MGDIHDDLREVMGLLGKATPGPWAAQRYEEDEEGCGVIAVDPEIGLRSPTRGQVAWFGTIAGASFESPGRCQANADLVAAAITFLQEHGPALLARQEGEDARDAARYRWLRANPNGTRFRVPCPDSIPTCKVGHRGPCLMGEELDAAIDAARSGGGG
jgi:hypothetical protein